MVKILEILWLVIGIGSILVGTYETYSNGLDKAYMFLIVTVVAGIMYTIRRRQRIKQDQESDK